LDGEGVTYKWEFDTDHKKNFSRSDDVTIT